MLTRLRQVLAKVRMLRGFITVPGFISLWGLVLAFLMLWLDLLADRYLGPDDLAWLSASTASANLILATVAGSAMAALSLVYSAVLVVFTLAAGTIAPRLLQRFSEDRISQVAVGMLGATFLYSLIVMRGLDEQSVPEISMTVAMLLAVMSVLMLLVFVNQAAKRVTVDEEIAAIARQLDEEIQEAISRGGSLDTDDIVWPAGASFVLTARKSGYVDYVDHEAMSEKAAPHQAFIDLDVMPGDYVMQGHKIARVLGARDKAFEEAVHKAIRLGSSRTPVSDVRFSVNLLVEIALRALSPGVNDTYTAVACVDRLSSSLMPLREFGIASGVHCDASGAARVTAPTLQAGGVIREAFDPMRRAASGNVLMITHIAMALGRLGRGEGQYGEDEIRRQLALIAKEIARSNLLEEDREMIAGLVEAAQVEVGQPMDSDVASPARIGT